MLGLLDRGADGMRAAEDAVEFARLSLDRGDTPTAPGGTSVILPLDTVTLLAPVPRPRRIRDYLTYEGHAAGSGLAVPEAFRSVPICYECNTGTVLGPGDPIPWPAYTEQLDFELEIGFYVGKAGRNISVEDAPNHIAGVTIFNDISARDIQFYEMSLNIGPSKGKSFGTVMGPCLLTIDEVDEFAIGCTARVNGEVWARADTGGRRYSFAEVLAWASYCEPVCPGEFLAVGTVSGGCGLELDRWIRPGDVVELEASGIGVLRNVVDEPEQVPPGAGIASYSGAPRVSTVH
ncbi:fumarylacetoacetate hydrolase family protein [Nocardia cyriacigeorgica]|uniref:fumarylacetoacetate hydrolase family protein n=1 Tax=Nocardia cyriacigeorgica TaxID=135487 RepID=UPI002458BFCA|nr:fumarylacetoacetate hydrolase family protein [Nocardia cyriacigeorgica]